MRRAKPQSTISFPLHFLLLHHTPYTERRRTEDDPHLWPCDPLDLSSPIPIRLASEEDGFRPSRGSRTGAGGVGEHMKALGDDLGLHLADSGEDVGAEEGTEDGEGKTVRVAEQWGGERNKRTGEASRRIEYSMYIEERRGISTSKEDGAERRPGADVRDSEPAMERACSA
jgi:hypothetical protein